MPVIDNAPTELTAPDLVVRRHNAARAAAASTDASGEVGASDRSSRGPYSEGLSEKGTAGLAGGLM